MKYSLDATTDYSHQELHSFLDINTIPEFVKQAECLSKTAADQLDDDAFADKYHRAFPISSAHDTYVSNAYFMNKKAELAKLWGNNYVSGVEDRLTKAASLFSITEYIASYNSNLMTKQAADYSEKIVASFDENGASYDLFPYKTAQDIAYHAQQFATNIKEYPFAWRSKIAQEFVKKAAEEGVTELPDIICKYGGMYFPDIREFQDTLARRMRKLSEAYQEKYISCVEKAASISSRQEALDICSEAYKIEKAAGVYDKPLVYREMGDIIDRTMTLSVTKIAEAMDVVTMDNDCYRMSDLQKIDKDIYKQAFGCELDPKNASELREVLPTMPGSDVALFRELSGVSCC
jgi:hypothetical protein